MIAGLTDDEVRHEVLVTPRRAYVRVPELRVIERPGWTQLVMPPWRDGGLNGVSLAVLADDEADAVIDATIAEYEALGLRFRWTVDPDSRPLDLGERLARRGLRPTESIAMACATDAPVGPAAPGITVERVTHATVDTFDRVMGEGWSMDPTVIGAYQRAAIDAGQWLYLARVDGVPAAIAGGVPFARSVYLVGGVVLPAFRGRGLYRALVATRLRDAAAAGIPLATTQANAKTSAPILARLGFTSICTLVSYGNR